MCRILSLILFLSLGAQAETLDIIAGGWSYHTDRDKSYRETHYNVGVSIADYSALYYRNSKGRHSVVLARDFLWGRNIRYGIAAGAVTGYGGAELPVPAVLAKLQYNTRRLGIDVHALPGYVYQMQLRYRTDYRPNILQPQGDSNWAASAGFGLTGGAYSIQRQLARGLNLRLTTNQWSKTWSEYHYPGGPIWIPQRERVRVQMTGAIVDYFPHRYVGVYAGAYYNHSEYTTRFIVLANDGVGQASGYYTAAPEPIPVTSGDEIHGRARWQRLAPTAGVRVGNPFNSAAWSLYADLGVTRLRGIRCSIGASVDGIGDYLAEWADRECAKYDGIVEWLPRAEVGVSYRF